MPGLAENAEASAAEDLLFMTAVQNRESRYITAHRNFNAATLRGNMSTSSLFVIASNSISFSDDAESWEAAAREFAARQALVVPGVLEKNLLAQLCDLAQSASYTLYDLGSIGHETVEATQRVSRSLNFLLSQPRLLRRLESLTGCGPLTSVGGNLGRICAGTGEHLGWHDDMNERGRKLAISICLSDIPYDGGEFELRSKRAQITGFTHKHCIAGVAVIFRIGTEFEHRVLPVCAGGPRLVYGGWFI